jgi:hypothetical protein
MLCVLLLLLSASGAEPADFDMHPDLAVGVIMHCAWQQERQ